MKHRIILLFFFLCVFKFTFCQNLIINPCFTPSNIKTSYHAIFDADSVVQFTTSKCFKFFYWDDLVIDTTCYIIEDWKEFDDSKGSFDRTIHDTSWYLCYPIFNDELIDSCFYLEFCPYLFWFDGLYFLAGTLSEKLIKGKAYNFSFQIKNLMESPFSAKEFGILFSQNKDTLITFLEKCKVPINADIIYSLNSLNDTNWHYFETDFIAKGYENFFFFGIFNENINKLGDINPRANDLYFKYIAGRKRIKDKNKLAYIEELKKSYGEIFFIDFSSFERLGMNEDYIIYDVKDFKIVEILE